MQLCYLIATVTREAPASPSPSQFLNYEIKLEKKSTVNQNPLEGYFRIHRLIVLQVIRDQRWATKARGPHLAQLII